MSKFFSERYKNLVPYTPGEQPQDMQYVKLNTNESPFPPADGVLEAVEKEAKRLQLYSDPNSKLLTDKIAEVYGFTPDMVFVGNGSDEILDFAFKSFCDDNHGAAFPNISYGFYPVYAEANHIPYTEIPLRPDFTIDIKDYTGINKTIFIANPNAPTGEALPVSDIEKIVVSNPESVVIVDEAYVDFGAESSVELTKKYKNVLVVMTFSKSRQLAGARLGFAFGDRELIADLNTLKYSTNPYNVNRMTSAAGIAALSRQDIFKERCEYIARTREYTVTEFKKLGFESTNSLANFIFVRTDKIDGKSLYLKLKERGVLIRHFDKPIISDYNRITIGSKEQMDILLTKIREITGD